MISPTRRFPRFQPLLAGANLRDRAVACAGALVGIALTGIASACLLHGWSMAPLLVAPMGASAVLVFAVPASPLAQPWPVVGGNTLSALVGIAAAHALPHPALAAAVAVSAAILVMSLLRCLHPPGGAAALLAVIGGPSVTSAGYFFALVPVGLNAVLLLAAGWLFHRVSGHSYPHRALPVSLPVTPGLLHPEDIDQALEDVGESFDIAREDLALLLERAEQHAEQRRRSEGTRGR